MRTNLWTARLGRDVPQKGGTSLESASQARRLKLPSTSTSILIPNSETKLKKGPAPSTLKNSGHPIDCSQFGLVQVWADIS